MFGKYLLAHKKNIIVWLIVCLVFALIFSLYDLPTAPVLYGSILSGFAGLVFTAVDFILYRRRCIVLQKLEKEITISTENLPQPRNTVEEEYTKLINILYDSLKAAENEAAEKLSDMTDYYTMWVHQIKTPIAAMGLILQSGDSPEYSELSENLQRIEQYAEMVLCYLRLDSDSSDLVIREYDLDDIVRQAVRKFSSQFIRRKLKLSYEPLDKKVLTDEKWLLFVIEQVISNAVKYTSSGMVQIYYEEPLTLCIKDTGIGIAAEDLPRIFEKGYTGCNGRLDKKASGIGLYLCKRICGRLGHKISAESSDNGTVIRIFLESRRLGIE
jgi:signal transduction histidine kinase